MAAFTRERFRSICRGERPGDFGILADVFTVLSFENCLAWVAQGAPPFLAEDWPDAGTGIPEAVRRYFDFDESRLLYEVHSGINSGSARVGFRGASFRDVSFLVEPPFGLDVVEEDDESLVFVSRIGSYEKVSKGSGWELTLPVQRPVRDRETWSRFKERLDPQSPTRYPRDWDAYVARVNALDCPVGMEVGGFFGYPNMWMGTQDLMLLFYDDPGLVEEMIKSILHLELGVVARVAADIDLDFVCYWEDMAYRSGPMISPAMTRRFMLPRYERLNEAVRAAGCDVFFLDSDGDVDLLVPLGVRRASTCSGRWSAPSVSIRWRCAPSTARRSSSPAAWTSASSARAGRQSSERSWTRYRHSCSPARTSRPQTTWCRRTRPSRASASTSICCAASAETNRSTSERLLLGRPLVCGGRPAGEVVAPADHLEDGSAIRPPHRSEPVGGRDVHSALRDGRTGIDRQAQRGGQAGGHLHLPREAFAV